MEHFICPVYLSIPWPDSPLLRLYFGCSSLSPQSLRPGIPEGQSCYEMETVFGTLAFSCVTRSPVLLNNRLTFSWAFLLPHMHLQKPFLLSLISFTRFSYIWALLFMGAQTMSPYSSQVILHPLYASFLCWSWSRSYSFVHAGLLTIFEIVVMDLFWSWRR